MDVAAASVVMKQASLSQQVNLAVTKKTMDVAEENSQALVKMMEKSVNPNLGGKFDVSV